jgi:DNA adenine methylase
MGHELEEVAPLFTVGMGRRAVIAAVLRHIPQHQHYVEAFAGAARVLLAKEPSPRETLIELNGERAQVWQHLKSLTDGEIEELASLDWRASRGRWEMLRDLRPTRKVDRLYRFLYLSYFSFGGLPEKGYGSWSAPRTRDPGRLRNRLYAVRERIKEVEIVQGDALEHIPRLDGRDTFFYLDPPFLGVEAERYWSSPELDYGRLFALLRRLKGRFLLNHPVHPEIERLSRGFERRVIDRKSTLRKDEGAREYLIANYPLRVAEMELAEVNPDSLASAPDRELVALHWGTHLLMGGGRVDPEKVARLHDLIAAEMERRGMEHSSPLGASPSGPPSIMIVPHYISLVGSSVYGKPGADLDLCIRQDQRDESLEVAIRKVLDPDKEKQLHFIYNARGPHAGYIPLWDLMGVPCREPAVGEVREVKAMKPAMSGVTDAYSVEEVWPWVQARLDRGVVAEPKWDGWRLLVRVRDGEPRFYSDTGKSHSIPALEELLRGYGRELTLDGELLLFSGGERLPRTETAGWMAGRVEAGPLVCLFDVLDYQGEDLRGRPLRERRRLLESVFPSLPGVFALTPQKRVEGRRDLEAAFRWGLRYPASEGIVLKALDSPYVEGGSEQWAKLKAVLEVKALVLEVARRKNGYTYRGGVLDDSGGAFENTAWYAGRRYVDLGMTFVTTGEIARVGDTLNVLVEELTITDHRLSWAKPRPQDVDESRGPYTVRQVLDMARRGGWLREVREAAGLEDGRTRAERAREFWEENWWRVWPGDGKGRFVLQAHWRGLNEEETKLPMDGLLETNHSLHYDLRLEGRDGWLWGWTIFAGEASENRPIPRIFRLSPQEPLQAAPKQPQPRAWLTVAHQRPHVGEPGQVGSTELKYSKFFELDSGTYGLGVMREHLMEVFLHGRRLKGRYLFEYAPLGPGGERRWLIVRPEDQTPYAVSRKLKDVVEELRGKGQKYLVWARPGATPRLVQVGEPVRHIKCGCCNTPVAEVREGMLVIRARHLGERHTTALPLERLLPPGPRIG